MSRLAIAALLAVALPGAVMAQTPQHGAPPVSGPSFSQALATPAPAAPSMVFPPQAPTPSMRELTSNYCGQLLSGKTKITIPRVASAEKPGNYTRAVAMTVQMEQQFISNCVLWQQRAAK
ncbi:MAG TPA: hypothetical protein VMF86_08780 [Stellaceae bacterium]|nr:hypothetical protein [Stellaceae bacterium]